MEITTAKRPGAALKKAAASLMEACAASDGAPPAMGLSLELNRLPEMDAFFLAQEAGVPVGVLTVFAPSAAAAELTAAVHPKQRRRGVFRRLLSAVCNEVAAHGYGNLLLAHRNGAGPGRALAGAWMLPLEHSEYGMRYCPGGAAAGRETPDLRLEAADPALLPRLAALSQAVFGGEAADAEAMVRQAMDSPQRVCYAAWQHDKLCGVCCANLGEETVYLYGLGIAPGLRGRGLGRALLRQVVAALAAHTGKPLALEVDSLNAAAFALYSSEGFTIEKQVDYYACTIEQLQPHLA